MTDHGPKCLVDALLEEQASSLEEGKEVIFTDERIKTTIIETVFTGKTISQHSYDSLILDVKQIHDIALNFYLYLLNKTAIFVNEPKEHSFIHLRYFLLRYTDVH